MIFGKKKKSFLITLAKKKKNLLVFTDKKKKKIFFRTSVPNTLIPFRTKCVKLNYITEVKYSPGFSSFGAENLKLKLKVSLTHNLKSLNFDKEILH